MNLFSDFIARNYAEIARKSCSSSPSVAVQLKLHFSAQGRRSFATHDLSLRGSSPEHVRHHLVSLTENVGSLEEGLNRARQVTCSHYSLWRSATGYIGNIVPI